jgi:hypothetical protein
VRSWGGWVRNGIKITVRKMRLYKFIRLAYSQPLFNLISQIPMSIWLYDDGRTVVASTAHGARLGVNPQLLRLCSNVSGRRCTAERPAGHGRSFENGRPGWRNEDNGRVLLLQLWLHCQRSPIAVLWASRRQAGPLREQPSAPSCPCLCALLPRLHK